MVTSVIICLGKRAPVAETQGPKQRRGSIGSLAHQVQEVAIPLRALELVVEELHRLHRIELGQHLAEHPDSVEHTWAEEELLLAGPRAPDVDRREDALVHQTAVQMDLHGPGAL